MPITIGSLTNVPNPGSPIASAWAQDATRLGVHRFPTKAALDAAVWPGLVNGTLAITTDTNQLWYRHSGAWLAGIWNSSWGMVAKQRVTVQSPTYTGPGNSDMVLTVLVRNDRAYEISANLTYIATAPPAIWAMTYTANGAEIGRCHTNNESYAFGETTSSAIYYEPATTATVTLRIAHNELTGSETIKYYGSPTLPRFFWIKDIGPRI